MRLLECLTRIVDWVDMRCPEIMPALRNTQVCWNPALTELVSRDLSVSRLNWRDYNTLFILMPFPSFQDTVVGNETVNILRRSIQKLHLPLAIDCTVELMPRDTGRLPGLNYWRLRVKGPEGSVERAARDEFEREVLEEITNQRGLFSFLRDAPEDDQWKFYLKNPFPMSLVMDYRTGILTP